ncbi:hypothetical protein [Archaeoglobus sp.]
MLADFLLPWILGLPFSSLFYSLISSALALIAFSLFSNTKLASKDRVLLVILAIWFLNLVGFELAIIMFRAEILLLYKFTGNYGVIGDINKIAFWGISGKVLNNILFSAASIPGSILMSYVSCYAYQQPNRKKVIIYWILINFAVTFIVISRGFCGYSPWKCG